jgi:TPR repeat protein
MAWLRVIKRLAPPWSANARFKRGKRYADVVGVPPDYVTAMKWYRLAADQGHKSAQSFLGNIYEVGVLDVQRDYIEAVKWYRLAANQNDKWAQWRLGLIYLDSAGRRKMACRCRGKRFLSGA